jgi:hypothetical protein
MTESCPWLTRSCLIAGKKRTRRTKVQLQGAMLATREIIGLTFYDSSESAQEAKEKRAEDRMRRLLLRSSRKDGTRENDNLENAQA